jgi:UDP-N-acetylmuramate--alanine ligase
MRNLAKLLLARGIEVSGSDLKDSNGLRELAELGADVRVGHDGANVGAADVVIVSSAIPTRNPERREAERRALPVWARQQAVIALATGRTAIAVAGTHGKTTITSMVATILQHADLDPTYLIGGDLNESGSGAHAGGGDLFLYEADESDGSFLLGTPAVGVIANVDVDHVDFYPGGREEIERAFGEFASRCARVVACGDDPGARAAVGLSSVTAVTYGTGGDEDVTVRVLGLGPQGARGTLSIDGGQEIEVFLRIDGEHNLLNAGAAVATAREMGVQPAEAALALRSFEGVHRRFELRGSARGAEIYDDYGHTPSEMAVTLQTARRREPRRLIAVVQPHRYTRVQALWRELGASVADADLVLVTDVYGAGQEPIPGVTGALVAEGVRLAAPEGRVVYLPHRADVIEYLDRELRDGDLAITMGCGDVWMLGDAVIERAKEAEP